MRTPAKNFLGQSPKRVFGKGRKIRKVFTQKVSLDMHRSVLTKPTRNICLTARETQQKFNSFQMDSHKAFLCRKNLQCSHHGQRETSKRRNGSSSSLEDNSNKVLLWKRSKLFSQYHLNFLLKAQKQLFYEKLHAKCSLRQRGVFLTGT